MVVTTGNHGEQERSWRQKDSGSRETEPMEAMNQGTQVRVGNTGRTELVTGQGRTPFQQRYFSELISRDDFDFICGNPDNDNDKYRGPYMSSWFDKAGRLHGDWVGAVRVLRRFINGEEVF